MANFLETQDVAKIVGLSAGRVRELAQAGLIKGFKPLGARRWLFTKEAVNNYLQGGEIC